MPDKPAIVFAGGGHAHLYSLLRTGELVRGGHRVVLVNPSRYLYYSGMATGVISRTYAPEEDRIDVRRLVERGGGAFVEGRVDRVLPAERELLLDDGRRVSYDVASFCIGSGVAARDLADGERAVPVKPVENTGKIRDLLASGDVAGSASSAGDAPRVLIVGGGAAGCEVAANAARLLEGRDGRILLAEAGPRLLGSAPEKAGREIHGYLESRGVRVFTNSRVASYADGVVGFEDGREEAADLVVPATGVTPPPVFRRSGLLTGGDGGLWVNERLQSVSDHRLFGGGDCVSFRGEQLPRLGVFAIRQGPVLFRNLRAALRGEPLESFEPQKRYLYALNLGDGTGLAIYGPFVWRGRSAMTLKHRIDQRFMDLYRERPA